jgi:hypothetical protein
LTAEKRGALIALTLQCALLRPMVTTRMILSR